MTGGSDDTLAYIKDRLDISDCVQRVSRGVDRLDEPIFLSAFHADAQLDYGFFVGSPKDFVQFFFPAHSSGQNATLHIINNHFSDIEGETAHAESYYIYSASNTDGSPVSLAGGRYLDRLERREGRWAIVVRKCIFEWNVAQDDPGAAQMAAAFAAVGNVSRDRHDLSFDRPLTLAPGRWEARTFA